MLNLKREVSSDDELYELIGNNSQITGVKIIDDSNKLKFLLELNSAHFLHERGVVFDNCRCLESALTNSTELYFGNPRLSDVRSDGLEFINWSFENDEGFIVELLCEKIYVVGI